MDSSSDDLDRIERHIDIDSDAERVWALVSRPGWWINDGEVLSNPAVEQHDDWWLLHDPVHGVFSIQTVRLDPPRHAAFRWKRGESQDVMATTRVDFTVVDRPNGVRLSVVETGFSSLSDDRAAWMSTREENVHGWEIEFNAARALLHREAVSRSVYLPAPPDEVWPFLVNHSEFARWYAFGGAHIEPVAGGRVELRWDEHGVFHGRVREVVPGEWFSFVLALEADVEPAPSNATLVAFKLRSYGEGGALLTIRQSGYEQLDENLGSPRELADQDRGSWEAGLDLLVDRVASPGRSDS